MSTDRKRLTSAIQRIAREDPKIRALLDDYRNSGGKPSSSATTGSGAEDRQTCCDGSSSGNANPGSGTRDPGDGGQDASDGLGGDPADIGDMGPGSLTGVTDCATGTPICFEGSDWIPPEGWDSPTDPPVDPTFAENIYGYSELGGSDSVHRTCAQARSAAIGYLSDCYDGPDCSDLSVGTKYSFFYATTNDCNDTGSNLAGQWGLKSCDDEFDPVCDDPEPLIESWDHDSCTNLAIKNGSIVGSKYDPENDGSYSKPRSEIQLCDDFGNQISIRPAGTGVLPTGEQTSVPERITGGWKTFNSTTSNGYLYDSSGTQIAHIDGNEYSDPNV